MSLSIKRWNHFRSESGASFSSQTTMILFDSHSPILPTKRLSVLLQYIIIYSFRVSLWIDYIKNMKTSHFHINHRLNFWGRIHGVRISRCLGDSKQGSVLSPMLTVRNRFQVEARYPPKINNNKLSVVIKRYPDLAEPLLQCSGNDFLGEKNNIKQSVVTKETRSFSLISPFCQSSPPRVTAYLHYGP